MDFSLFQLAIQTQLVFIIQVKITTRIKPVSLLRRRLYSKESYHWHLVLFSSSEINILIILIMIVFS